MPEQFGRKHNIWCGLGQEGRAGRVQPAPTQSIMGAIAEYRDANNGRAPGDSAARGKRGTPGYSSSGSSEAAPAQSQQIKVVDHASYKKMRRRQAEERSGRAWQRKGYFWYTSEPATYSIPVEAQPEQDSQVGSTPGRAQQRGAGRFPWRLHEETGGAPVAPGRATSHEPGATNVWEQAQATGQGMPAETTGNRIPQPPLTPRSVNNSPQTQIPAPQGYSPGNNGRSGEEQANYHLRQTMDYAPGGTSFSPMPPQRQAEPRTQRPDWFSYSPATDIAWGRSDATPPPPPRQPVRSRRAWRRTEEQDPTQARSNVRGRTFFRSR